MPTRIDIYINPGPKKDAPGYSSPQGTAFPRRDPEYLPRRKTLKIVDVRFFDLGRYADGSDIPFYVANAVTKNTRQYVVGAGNFTSANWQSLINVVSPADALTWASTFRPIAESELQKFGIQIANNAGLLKSYYPGVSFPPTLDADGIEYTGGVLKVKSTTPFGGTRSQILADIYSGGFYGPSDIKITATPTYAAAAVPFTFSADTDFFLLPRMFLELGCSAAESVDGAFTNHYSTGALNFVYRALPRAVYLDSSFPAGTTTTTTSSAFFNTVSGIVEALPGARYFVNTTKSNLSGTTDPFSSAGPAPSVYPDPQPPFTPTVSRLSAIRWITALGTTGYPLSYPHFSISGEIAGGGNVSAEIEEPSAPQILAVAVQGSNAFYIWNTPASFLSCLLPTVTKTVRSG